MSDKIKIVVYEEKYKSQVIEMHKRLTPSNLQVRRMQWIGMFIKSNGIVNSIIYFGLFAYLWHFLLNHTLIRIIKVNLNFTITTLLFLAFIFLVLFPYLTKVLAKQAKRYADQIADDDLEDIVSNYQSCADKNFWVALDEYQNPLEISKLQPNVKLFFCVVGDIKISEYYVCGSIGLANTMPIETQHHLGKYIKEEDGIKIADLKRVMVSETHRRKGIASLLINQAVSFAKQQSFRAIVITTISVNQPSVALYKRSGFFFVSSFFFQILWKIFGIQIEVYLKLI